MKENERLIYPDVLKIVSILGVIIIHTVAEYWGYIPMHSKSWVAMMIADSLSRFAAPVFIMVSGMFMLSPEKDRGLKYLYSKKILRIATAFLFWSAVYTLFHCLSVIILKKAASQLSITETVKDFVIGEEHLWFMYMIIGLYIVTPLLRKLVDNKSTIEYFLAIWFVFCIIKNCVKLFPVIGDFGYEVLDYFKISVALEYSGYYVLGYYLHNYPPKKMIRILTYVLSVLSVAAIAFMTVYSSFKTSKLVSDYFEYLLPITVFPSAAVFMLVQNICKSANPSQKCRKYIFTLSKISFGVYLSHPLVMTFVKKISVTYFPSLPAFVLCAIMFALALTVSSVASYIMNKIPIINKYIV